MPDPTPHELPALAVGHLVLQVAQLEKTYGFYANLGLRTSEKDDAVAILELRGGTHLLLVPRPNPDIAPPAEQIDLMIASRTLDDLTTFRARLIERGVAATEIPPDRFFGHWAFTATDPEGNVVTISTSHVGALPV